MSRLIKLHSIQHLVTLEKCREKEGRDITQDDLSIITDGCIVYDYYQIQWIGKTSECPIQNAEEISLEGTIVIPQLISLPSITL